MQDRTAKEKALELTFLPSLEPSLGVEVELQIVDAETGDLIPAAPRLLKACAEESLTGVTAELMQSMIEAKTGICQNLREVREQLFPILAPQPVMPAKAGIQVEWRGKAWIPAFAFAGMTREQNLRGADRPSAIVVQHERRLLAGPAVVIGGGFRGRPVRATMYHMITVLVLLFTLLMPGAATAEPTPETAGRDELERRFRLADRDGDGVLSAAEARQGGWFVDRMEDFERIDRDRSGTITLFEIVGALSEKVQDWLGADADQDGRVSEAEAKRRPGIFGQVFRDADRDGDGYVTREEIELLSQRSYYRDAELPSVAPNIIEKRF